MRKTTTPRGMTITQDEQHHPLLITCTLQGLTASESISFSLPGGQPPGQWVLLPHRDSPRKCPTLADALQEAEQHLLDLRQRQQDRRRQQEADTSPPAIARRDALRQLAALFD